MYGYGTLWQVAELCAEIESLWSRLESEVERRGKELELTLRAQQYLFEAQEVDNWLAEKSDILHSTELGRDRDATTKLLTKHKVNNPPSPALQPPI